MAGASQPRVTGPQIEERVILPGFGLSVRDMPTRSTRDVNAIGPSENIRLPHAIADWCGSSGVTVYERNMLGFMSQITDKPKWDDKVFDERTVQKWHQEVSSQYRNFTDGMFNYVSLFSIPALRI